MTNHKQGQYRVLVVDDDRDFSDGLVELLRTKGYLFDQAFNDVQAIEKLDTFNPDVILLDLRLGRSDGLRVLEEVKVRNHPALTVVITAYSSKESAIKALRDGAFDYLQKPVHPDFLFSVLNRCVDRIQLEQQLLEYQRELERKVQERTKELEESKEMYRTLARVSPVGMLRINNQGECEYVNTTFCELLESDREHFLGDGWKSLICDEHRGEFLSEWDDYVNKGLELFEKECIFDCQSGQYIWALFQAKRVNGGNGGYVSTIVNISAQKELLPQLLELRDDIQKGNVAL